MPDVNDHRNMILAIVLSALVLIGRREGIERDFSLRRTELEQALARLARKAGDAA